MARSRTTSLWPAGPMSVPYPCSHLPVLSMIQGGYTVILVPRGDNLETKAIKTAYSSAAGTAFVTFDKVRVPVSNTLGKIGKGMQVILSNFNHEVIVEHRNVFRTDTVIQRWMIAACALGMQRLVVEECLKYVRCFCFFISSLTPGRWSNQRIAFGKPLHAQAVVRAKLAGMISRVESSQNWLESVTYQMNNVCLQPTHTE